MLNRVDPDEIEQHAHTYGMSCPVSGSRWPQVVNCLRCGGCVLCGHANDCPDPSVEIVGDPEKSQCAVGLGNARPNPTEARRGSMTSAWTCPVPGHDPTFVDEDGVMHWAVESRGGVARCLVVGCDRTSADRRDFYGPGNPQCLENDSEGRECVGPMYHPDGSDHANQYGSWPHARGDSGSDPSGGETSA